MEVKSLICRIFDCLVLNMYEKPLLLLRLLKRKDLFSAQSYFPEKNARPIRENLIYQVSQILKFGWPNEFFFLYGLDVKSNTERREYINYRQFRTRRDMLNNVSCCSSICILRNKLFFDVYANALSIDTPRIVAVYSRNSLYDVSSGFRKTSLSELALKGNRTLFCKEKYGESGKGIFKLNIVDNRFYLHDKEMSTSEIYQLMQGEEYLFQEEIVQHPLMNQLYPYSINTIRLVTVRGLKDGQIHVLPSILRIGSNGSIVDNTSQGGIAVGFNLISGQLNKYGFYKPQFGRKTDFHPNTGINFSEFFIPFIKEAEERAIYFHSMLNDIHSIGWDIAIGTDGPIFIEGNDNWEINGPQVGNHGMRSEFEEYFF